jgi:hypothetical protein
MNTMDICVVWYRVECSGFVWEESPSRAHHPCALAAEGMAATKEDRATFDLKLHSETDLAEQIPVRSSPLWLAPPCELPGAQSLAPTRCSRCLKK